MNGKKHWIITLIVEGVMQLVIWALPSDLTQMQKGICTAIAIGIAIIAIIAIVIFEKSHDRIFELILWLLLILSGILTVLFISTKGAIFPQKADNSDESASHSQSVTGVFGFNFGDVYQYILQDSSDGVNQESSPATFIIPEPTPAPAPAPAPTSTPTPSVTTEPLSMSEYTGIPSEAHRVQFSDASASSVHTPEADCAYDPNNVILDGVSDPWVAQGPGDGVGEWLKLSFPNDETISVLGLHLGFASYKGKDVYYGNYRPREIQFDFSDGTSVPHTFEDYNRMQYVQLSRPITTKYVKITILSAYPTNLDQDIAITAVRAYDEG